MASAAIPTHRYAIAHGAVPIGNSEGVVVSIEEMAKGDELRFQSFRLQTRQPFALPSTPPFILNFFPLCGSLRNLSLKIALASKMLPEGKAISVASSLRV